MPAYWIYCLMYQGIPFYVGSTSNPKRRKREHKSRKTDSKVPPEISNFVWHILEANVDKEDRFKREQFWIDYCCPIYNKGIACKIRHDLS